jgi:hypothetical protein
MNHQSKEGSPPKRTPAKTQPKKHHNSRENGTAKRTTRKKTTDSRELALGLRCNNSENPRNTHLTPREKQRNRPARGKKVSTRLKRNRSISSTPNPNESSLKSFPVLIADQSRWPRIDQHRKPWLPYFLETNLIHFQSGFV